MSYKSEFASNNVDLQGLIDYAKTMPTAENLDYELSEQDAIIAELEAILDRKTSAPLIVIDDGKGNITIATYGTNAISVG